MSGRHAVQRFEDYQDFRPPLRPVLAAWDWLVWHTLNGFMWVISRIAGEDLWVRSADGPAMEPAAPMPAPAPVPAALSVDDSAPTLASTPVRLAPKDAAAHLNAENHPLPWEVLEWRIGDDVHGQVRSLDCGPDRMRAVVSLYAEALGVAPREDKADEGRVVLTAAGEYAGVLFIISAVFIAEDTIPLRVFAEAAEDESLTDTLTTQAIPDRVLEEVLGK